MVTYYTYEYLKKNLKKKRMNISKKQLVYIFILVILYLNIITMVKFVIVEKTYSSFREHVV